MIKVKLEIDESTIIKNLPNGSAVLAFTNTNGDLQLDNKVYKPPYVLTVEYQKDELV